LSDLICFFAHLFVPLHPKNEEMEKKELKAALFDLDGVVFDTEPQYTVFWGSQCRLYHPEHPGWSTKSKAQRSTRSMINGGMVNW
jgi:hypothetical protein